MTKCVFCGGFETDFDPSGTRLVACPRCRGVQPTPPRFTAYVGGEVVEAGDDLSVLVESMIQCYEFGLDEDLAFWEGKRLLCVWLSSGRVLWMQRVAVVS
jgi:hypothetical protein